ncbi:MAG: zinc ribbon domain-containing protein [Clostridiales bacterium]|nr:zinc ribbon domain-containing protein [Clostridiales bacterium]
MPEYDEEFYMNATIDRLDDLAVNGDDDACVFYIMRKIEASELTEADVARLDGPLKNLNRNAACVGAMVYEKRSIFADEEKELFSYAIIEQDNDGAAHKRLTKSYKASADIIDKIDLRLMRTAIDFWAAETIRGKTSRLDVRAERMTKDSGYPDYKSALIVALSITEPSGRATEFDNVYVAYLRGKDERKALSRLQDELTEEISQIAEKCGVPYGEIKIDGRTCYRFGGGAGAQRTNGTPDHVNILSNAEVDIRVADDGRLGRTVCAHCGGTLDDNGVCTACGRKHEKTDDGIVIHKSKDMEALLCTQCGSPVNIDAGGKTAVCPYCGTTFAVNGSSLAAGVFGINYEDIKADMPIGATLPDIKFVRASVADDKIAAVMPESFIVMPEAMRRIKYNANAPKHIYTTPDGTVNFNLNFTGALSETDVFDAGSKMLGMMKSVFPNAKFGEAQKLTTPRNIFKFELLTAALDQSVYNVMFIFSIDGKQGVGSWNCLGKDRWFWAPIFDLAIRTMSF